MGWGKEHDGPPSTLATSSIFFVLCSVYDESWEIMMRATDSSESVELESSFFFFGAEEGSRPKRSFISFESFWARKPVYYRHALLPSPHMEEESS